MGEGGARGDGLPGDPAAVHHAEHQAPYGDRCPRRHPSPRRYQVHRSPRTVMTRILVTGGTGVLGTKLVATLRAKGHDVWFSDRGHHFDPRYMRADIGEYRQIENVVAE